MNTDTFFGGGADDSLFGEEATASGLDRSEPGETQTAFRFEHGPILPSPLLHSLAAKVELPEGQTVVHVTVTPGETVELPFAADAQFLVRLGDGNLAIKVGDVTIILEGYADASGDPEHPIVIHSADGAPLDIAALLAATDPAIDIETAAGPGDPGGQGTDNTGAIFQQLGDQGDGDGTPGAAGAQGDTTGPGGGDQGDAGGDPNQPQVLNDLGPTNAAPETNDTASAGLEDAVSIAVPLSGLDSDGFVALFAITSLPSDGALYADAALTVLLAVDATVPAVAGAATVYFVPDLNFNGTPSFQYAAIDNGGLQDATPATATITVTPVNDPPLSVYDATTVNEGGTTTIAVLANDTDADGDPLTVTVVTGPAHGAVTVNPDGTIAYTHDGSETTSDSFTYKVNDGTVDGNIMTVTIFVTPVNDAPVANPDAYAVDEGGILIVTAANKITLNDTDAENNTLTAVLVHGPANGTLSLNGDGTFTYAHDGSETTTDSFTYKASDGSSSGNTTTVTITINPVNDAPVAQADAVSVAEGGTATILTGGATSVLANDTDPEGNTLSAILVSGPANGLLLLNSDGTFSYTHNGGETTSDSFTYKANDGTANGNTMTVTITVTPVNDAPVTVDDSYAVDEGGTLTVTAANKITLNDTDAENDPLTALVVSGPANGTLTISPDGTFTYVHDGSATTSDSFTYRADDGTANGNVATVHITVNPVNDAPVAVADSITVAEGGVATVLDGGATSILSNDTDIENDPLTAILITGPANGVLSLNSNGTFTYTHDGSETTTDSFTYKANDGIANSAVTTVTITITPVNDPPVANPDAYAVDEGGTLTVTAANKITLNDTDAEHHPLTAILVSNPANGTLTLNFDGTFTYVHDGSETISDSFTYRTIDSSANSNTATVTITINPVNDPPVANLDAITVAEGGTATVLTGGATSVLVNDTDAENDTLSAILVSGPTNGTLLLNADGKFTYTHNGGETTTDSFTYQADDGTTSGTPTMVNITITPVNDAPIAGDDAYIVDEGGTLTVALANKITLNDTDPENSPLTAVLVNGPQHGSLTLNADGTFTYTHNGGETTSDSFTYKANDGTTSGSVATVSITINPVNDAPVAVDDYYTMDDGGTLTVTAANKVTLNDTDAENDPLTAYMLYQPLHGTITFNTDGTFTYVHGNHGTTSTSFAYQVSDGTALGSTAIVHITINQPNQPPVANADSITVAEGDFTTVLDSGASNVLTNDFDLENDPLTAVLVSGPTNGTLLFNADGTFSYTHNGGETTSDSFTYKANDGTASGNTTTVTITVVPVNDAPVARDDAYVMAEGGTLTVTAANKVTLNDTDVENNALTVAQLSQPSHGTVTVNGDGTFTYAPHANYHGTDSFIYIASDGNAISNIATVTITVNAANHVPASADDSYTVSEDAVLTIAAPGVLGNDLDADGDALHVSTIVTGASHGSLVLQPGGSFTYTPDANYNGTDSFTYKANDGTADGNTAKVNITVNPVNDVPLAVNDSYTTYEDTPLNFAAPGILGNDFDVDGDSLHVAAIVTGPSHGSLVHQPDGSFTYTPDANYNGTDSFTYRAHDGTAAGNIATVDITVNPMNDAPLAVNDSYTTYEDTPLNFAAPGILGNDFDVDGDSLQVAAIVTGPSHGALLQQPDGSFTYTPDADYNGTDSFTYKSNDGSANSNTATVSITISPVNHAPVANDDGVIVVRGGTTSMLTTFAPSVLSNDSDADGNPLTAAVVHGPAHGSLTFKSDGTLSYTHDGSANLTDSFTYKANDGTADSNTATVNITIEEPNFFTPMAANDSIALAKGGTTAALANGALSVLANDTDMDAFSVLTATLLTPVAHGTLTFNADGTFSYTHDGTSAATDSFTYWVSDGIHTSMPAVVSIAIDIPPVDPGPTANADRVFTNLGSTGFQIPEWALLYNDLGKDATHLDVTAVSGIGFNPPVHTDGIGSAGYVTFTGDMFGGGNFTYAAIEGGVTGNTATVTVQNFSFGPITGNASQDILIGSAAGDTLNGGGAIGTKGDLIFAGDGNDSIFFHTLGPVGQPGTADVVDGGGDTVAKAGGLMAGLGGDVLAITELTVDFTDGFKLSGIEGITTNNGGMPVAHSVTLNATNVIDMSDHSIAPGGGGVFSSQHAIYINAGALDALYLSVSDGGKWQDTGQFATDGVSKIYVHDTTIGTPGNSENAYVIVAPTTGTVHLNQDP